LVFRMQAQAVTRAADFRNSTASLKSSI
jgi:hypothetical protein